MNPSKAWNAKLEAASFFCQQKICTTGVLYDDCSGTFTLLPMTTLCSVLRQLSVKNLGNSHQAFVVGGRDQCKHPQAASDWPLRTRAFKNLQGPLSDLQICKT